MCIRCNLIQTCRECHWDEVFNWGPVSAAKRSEERPAACILIPRHVKATGFFNFMISRLLCRSTQSKARISPELKGRSLFSWTTEKTNHLCLWEIAVWGEFSGSLRVQLFKFMTKGAFLIQHIAEFDTCSTIITGHYHEKPVGGYGREWCFILALPRFI